MFPLRTLGSSGFTAEKNQIIAVATSTRFKWPDDQLEAVHDFIQWLFPLPESSVFNAAAPILNRESMQEFRKRPEWQQNLRVSFLRMMKLYGLEFDFDKQIKVPRAPIFTAKATVCLSPGN